MTTTTLADDLRRVASAPTQHPTWRIAELLEQAADTIDDASDEYNGHTNFETWAAITNLSNDYDLYQIARRLVAEADTDTVEFYDEHEISCPPIADTHAAGDRLAEWVADMVADYHDGQRSQLVRCLISDVGSFHRVDWRAVADSFREEANTTD